MHELEAEFSAFDFPKSSTLDNVYSFTLDSDTFIQLCILGNIIQPRKGGGLEGVAQHLEDFIRVKAENINTSIGGLQRFEINANVYLITKILKREPYSERGAQVDDDSPVRYDIEYHSLLVRSAQLLRALETYVANSGTSTALVLRAVT